MIHAEPNARWRRFKFTADKDVDESEYYLAHRNERHSNPELADLPFYGYIRRDRLEILDRKDRYGADSFTAEVEAVHGYTIETLVRDYEAEGYKDVGGYGTTEYLERLAKRSTIGWAVAVITGKIRVEQWGRIGDTDKVALKIIEPNGKVLLDDIPELDADGRLPPMHGIERR
jgi:hypothetical protein